MCGDSSLTAVIAGLDHVQVAAPPGCEAEARAFYGRLLGLEELEKPPALAARGGAWFACGAQQLHVGVAADFTPATKAHPGLRVTARATSTRSPSASPPPARLCTGTTSSRASPASTPRTPGGTGSSCWRPS